MLPRRFALLACLTLSLLAVGPVGRLAGWTPAELPSNLTDQEFWRLTEELSEPNGSFRSDNLLSNELVFARILPDLAAKTKPGGAYLGVGPEQNFTYMAALRPRIAFITDVRRGNLHLQLMYKALFELSKDRADFISWLFTKPRPAGLTAASTAAELINAYWETRTSAEDAYSANLRAILEHLTRTHAFPLSDEDRTGIAAVYRAFYWYGPAMNYSANTSLATTGAGRIRPTYGDLMMQAGADGEGLSFLSSEEKFAFLRDLESRNLVVPVVGDLGGSKALRSVGTYLRDHAATVTAFYVPSLEIFLRPLAASEAFCGNVATMPIDDQSVLIRPAVTVVMLPSGATGYLPRQPDGTGAAHAAITIGTGGTVTTVTTAMAAPGESVVPIATEVASCKR